MREAKLLPLKVYSYNFELLKTYSKYNVVHNIFRCLKEDEDVVCSDTLKASIRDDAFCGYIENNIDGPFKECIELADSESVALYYEDCEYDVCANWDDPADEVCRSLETFIAFCYEIGAGEINFRTDMFCPGKVNGTRTRRCEILGRLLVATRTCLLEL